MKKIITWAAQHPVFSNMATLLVFFIGFQVLPQIKREHYPTITEDDVVITGLYPGASTEEVEESIVVIIENSLRGTNNIQRIRSTASEGSFEIHADLFEKLSEEEKKESHEKIRQKIEQLPYLPEGIKNLSIYRDTQTSTAYKMIVYGDVDELSLHHYCDDLITQMQQAGISDVDVTGKRPYELSIELDQEKLLQWNLNYGAVQRQIQEYTTQQSLGIINSSGLSSRLEIRGRKYSASQFRQVPIRLDNGKLLSLGEIATIKDAFQSGEMQGRFLGKAALRLKIYRPNSLNDRTLDNLVDKFLGD